MAKRPTNIKPTPAMPTYRMLPITADYCPTHRGAVMIHWQVEHESSDGNISTETTTKHCDQIMAIQVTLGRAAKMALLTAAPVLAVLDGSEFIVTTLPKEVK